MYSVCPYKHCPHIISFPLCPLDKFKEVIDFSSLKCKNCEEKNELWICLKCGESYCGRYIKSHYLDHYINNNEHCICISALDLSVWCYQCTTPGFDDPGSYIESDKVMPYYIALSDAKFGKDFVADKNNVLKVMQDAANSIKKVDESKYQKK